MEGVVVAKRDAERQYEKSLAEGDAPVMLEANADGLHTANIGNLKPGDELVLEVRYGQVLSFEQGRLRIAVPTTIAPRYGSPHAAGLQPQQVPSVSISADHRLALALDVMAPLDAGTLDCPTHKVTREPIPGGARMRLQGQAWLDRDLVLLVKPREERPSLVVQARDARSEAAPLVVMAALQPREGAMRHRIAVKALVDCSGSMGGDSIASARLALQGLLAKLTGGDCLSISRFGTTVEHVFPPTPCTASALSAASRAVATTDANLGGTEMEAALRSVFAVKVPEGHDGADVLLLTDGEIWQSEAVVAAARASGHRVFAIGVGSAPAEGVLRALAEATGGACEFATPGEALEAAAQRMLNRMRQAQWNSVRVDWGAEPAWQLPIAGNVFGGDTVVVFAGFAGQGAVPVIRLMARDAAGLEREIARSEASVPSPGDALTRIAASRRLAGASEEQALRLAIDYQLMSRETNCILVHDRSASEKATDPAELHRVSSMLAAGWGATGVVFPAQGFPAYAPCAAIETFGSMADSIAASEHVVRSSSAPPRLMQSEPVRYCSVDSDWTPESSGQDADESSSSATLEMLSVAVIEHLRLGGAAADVADTCWRMPVHPEVRRAIEELVALGMDVNAAWVLLAQWVNRRRKANALHQTALLDWEVGEHAREFRAAGRGVLERLLGGFEIERWPLSRRDRLARAMHGSDD
jgi:Ca-activated chloride channel family protein